MIEAREARLSEAFDFSAQKLQGMEEFGYSWKNYCPLPTSSTKVSLNGGALGSNKSPIALSSTSDSEDDVPLARRVRIPASDSPLEEEDVPLATRMPGAGTADKSGEPHPPPPEQDQQRELDHPGGAQAQAQGKAQSWGGVQPKREAGGVGGGNGESEDEVGKPGVWEHISHHQSAPRPHPRKPHPKRKAAQSPTGSVIDLESDGEMGPLSPPPKAGFGVTKLKTLQRTNPGLGKAVSKL